jgi:hypothetical protein
VCKTLAFLQDTTIDKFTGVNLPKDARPLVFWPNQTPGERDRPIWPPTNASLGEAMFIDAPLRTYLSSEFA